MASNKYEHFGKLDILGRRKLIISSTLLRKIERSFSWEMVKHSNMRTARLLLYEKKQNARRRQCGLGQGGG